MYISWLALNRQLTFGIALAHHLCPTLINRSLHISLLTLLVDYLHQSWLVHIATMTSSNGRRHHLFLLRISQVIFANKIQYQTRPIYMSYCLCASVRQHNRQKMPDNFCQGICPMGKRRRSATSDIVQVRLVIDRPHLFWLVHISQ